MRTLPFLTILLLACGTRLHAQTSRSDPVDVQSRFGMDVNINLPKKFESTLGYELRMVNNASTYRGSYWSGELGYNLRKRLSVFSSYRFAQVTDAVSHRFAVGAQVEQKRGKRMTFSFRPMLQYQKQLVDDDGQTIKETTYLRTRFRAKFQERKHLAFYGSVEPAFTFHSEFPIDNWRNTAGLQYEFTKNRKIDLHYSYRADYAKTYNRTFHVLGVGFILDMKLPR